MAFQSMMNGSECGPSNPLSSLLKQQATDTSHHSTQFNPSHPSNLQSMRTIQGSSLQHEEAERFFQAQQLGTGASGGGGGQAQGHFAMDGLRRELEGVQRGGGDKGPIVGDREWASQYHPASSSLSPAEVAHMEEQFRQSRSNELSGKSFRAFDFLSPPLLTKPLFPTIPSIFLVYSQSDTNTVEYFRQQQNSPGPSLSSAPQASSSYASQQNRPGFAPSYGPFSSMSSGMGMGMGMGSLGTGMGGQMGMYGAQQPQPSLQMEGKGKGRFVELDDATWEAQFAAASSATTSADPESTTADPTTTTTTQPTTMNLLDGDTTLSATSSDAELMSNLEDTWANLQNTLTQSSISDSEMAAWEAQYGSQFSDINGDSGLGDDLSLPATNWTSANIDSFLNNTTAYPFAKENDYLGHPDAYEEGKRLLKEGAPLSEAALAFEAACQVDGKRAEAWRAAGETWAADERETKGIRALEMAVGCGGVDGVAAWMVSRLLHCSGTERESSLAVAYVNEGQELRALATLEKWLSLAYPSILLPPSASTAGPWDTSNRVIDLFLLAARAGPEARLKETEGGEGGRGVDPDVQVGLGVLFYSNSDYERAKDCFEAALSVRPSDFLLWNRLGATLANGGLPEEAISAYRKALDLRPTFTRATYNLGVSCLNIGCYHEAAEHLLAAIEGQRARSEGGGNGGGDGGGMGEGEDDGSANLWHTLRRSFLCMDQHDLAELAHPGTDIEVFRQHGFEF
ncbi:peroxin-5, partial [Phenoliferia sp. Uapishka_3]